MNQPKAPEVIFYGGTFNPPHCGHLQITQEVVRRWPAATLLISVTPTPVQVGDPTKLKCQTAVEVRRKWCELAFETVLDHPNVKFTSIETTLPAPQRSVDTLEALRGLYPQRSLGLVMGQDQWAKFPQWYQPQQILGLTHIIISPRRDSFLTPDNLQIDVAIPLHQLNIAANWHNDVLKTEDPGLGNIFVLENVPCNAASRVIRRLLRARDQIPAGWLPEQLKNTLIRTKPFDDQSGNT